MSSVCLVLWASLSEIKIDDGDDVDDDDAGFSSRKWRFRQACSPDTRLAIDAFGFRAVTTRHATAVRAVATVTVATHSAVKQEAH